MAPLMVPWVGVGSILILDRENGQLGLCLSNARCFCKCQFTMSRHHSMAGSGSEPRPDERAGCLTRSLAGRMEAVSSNRGWRCPRCTGVCK
ncbi:hypothetical protein CCHR01_04628 [Colletotrichum chrysophilum]|uniref:Uncharacterized protein n=1 Tax=Colletotrichum chrysophilum TaxID=1836956 RepID=A0AAD9AS42_9PEZI|nr:hypothetical protein CCHR01_04628 [Colletotrichum chrysophilum]